MTHTGSLDQAAGPRGKTFGQAAVPDGGAAGPEHTFRKRAIG
ncbi:hypothetical protein AB0N24_23840 [Arthrobacter sp. NPDC093128]